MKNAPSIQYEIVSDRGGTCVVTRANHPSISLIALLTDSLSTSTYGHSFVRTGGTLYRMPIIQSANPDNAKYQFTERATRNPTTPRSSHSA